MVVGYLKSGLGVGSAVQSHTSNPGIFSGFSIGWIPCTEVTASPFRHRLIVGNATAARDVAERSAGKAQHGAVAGKALKRRQILYDQADD